VKSIAWRTQLWFIALGYAAVFALLAALLLKNYLMRRYYPAESAGGMAAFGELIGYVLIACLFMVPTAFLVRVMAQFEALYTTYSQLLVGISLSAPVCLSWLYFGKAHVSDNLKLLCTCRLLCAPFVLVGAVISRLVARSDQAKKLTVYALVIEGLTAAGGIALLVLHR
jgi:hypothetical protein